VKCWAATPEETAKQEESVPELAEVGHGSTMGQRA
jgi:hypothetical protein